ncbi:hypothetical protein CkaCkLH20_08790 [Colletotrichum karsti]|uniref:Uncharacterized protein n=1 Tax=Colletotrichum karsti TaxID=1095194 RepID=A0A9P6I0Q7_9PEZI|nr:uncharacterized protein CkaCkLH20_08790 [Colletotrichum karsti]KAF9873680.1 hypothetical protein CkaCkLH20_08790 [Colletotrichum karsti]
MAYLATRHRALPMLSQATRTLPFTLRSSIASTRYLSDKPGLEATDTRDAADAKKTNPPQPKITNSSVPGQGPDKLTEEQKREVDEHNRDFEKKLDRAQPAADDKVDKKFWGSGTEDTK